jgi:serine/threonine protein kinase
LRRNPYTQAADIYSFGMIMYFVATGKQPFANCEKDEFLVLDICNGIRPEINESEAPKYYIDLMKKCWDPNPDNRPRATEICEMIDLFHISYLYDESDFKHYVKIEKGQQHYDIEKQFKEAEEYRKISNLFDDDNSDDDGDDDDDDDDDDDGDDRDDGDDNDDNDKSSNDDDGDNGDHEDDGEYDDNSRPQSQLLNPLLSKISECLDCEIMIELS